MIVKSKTVRTSACWVLLALSAAPTLAQTGAPSLPYRGLFGERRDQTAPAPNRLDLSATVAAAYDDDVYADSSPGVTPTFDQPSGYFSMLLAGADYNWHGQKTHFGATGSAALRYYPELDSVESMSYVGGIGFSTQFARRTTVFANQAVSYSPSYLYGLFPSVATPMPGNTPPPAPDYSAYETESYMYTTRIAISHGLTRRGQLSGAVDVQRTDFLHEAASRHDLTAYGAQAIFMQNTSRNLALRFGYRFRTGDFGYSLINPKATEHGIDVGMEYNRPLSPTRRLTFGFSLGPAAVDSELTLNELGAVDRQYHLMADTKLGYQFAKTWQTNVSFRRGLEYVPGLRTPVYSNGFTSTIDGLINRRLSLQAAASFSDGRSLVAREGSTFDTYTVDMQARYAFGRMWALYSEYMYYYYDFRGSAQLPVGVPPVLERNAVRLGLTFWVPMTGR
jgi:hypothetical protein